MINFAFSLQLALLQLPQQLPLRHFSISQLYILLLLSSLLPGYTLSISIIIFQLSVELLQLVILILKQFAIFVLKITLPLQSFVSSLEKHLIAVSDTFHACKHFVVPIYSFFFIFLCLELLVSHIEFLH